MSTKQVEKFETLVEIPDGVTASINKYMLQVQGPLGKTFKNFKKIPVTIQVKDNKILINAQGTRKKDFAILNTARSIIRNLCEGVSEGYTVKLKIVYAHFPVSVKMKDDKILVENFQGERSPRIAKVVGSTKVVMMSFPLKNCILMVSAEFSVNIDRLAYKIIQKLDHQWYEFFGK